MREHPLQTGASFLGREPGELLQVHLVEEELLEPADLRVVGDDLGLVGGLQPGETTAELASHGIVTDRLIVRSVITTMEGARAVTVTPWSGPKVDTDTSETPLGRLAAAAACGDCPSE